MVKKNISSAVKSRKAAVSSKCGESNAVEKPATDVYTFENLRRGDFTYVDKTEALIGLIDESIGRQFFIARPRRFGKSLCVSTLKAIFEGKKELFQGLAIEKKWDWKKKWSVLHLDMGSCQAPTVEALWKNIIACLESEAKRIGVKLPKTSRASVMFRKLIEALADKCKVKEGGKRVREMVLLVDEYDKPLLGHLCKDDVVEFRDALKEFYSVIKTTESMQRFAFITGISKFSKVSIFSDLNNLIDLTMVKEQSSLFGYTHEEVKKYYPKMIAALGEELGLNSEEAFAKICAMYDGYRFHQDGERIINPVSLGQCLRNRDFNTYWSDTAVPTFLIDILKKNPLNFETIDLPADKLKTYEPERPQIETLLYQTGYLTIKGSRTIAPAGVTGAAAIGKIVYELGFPNHEVEDSFLSLLVPAYTGIVKARDENAQLIAAERINGDDVEGFLEALDVFFHSIPYNLTDRQNEQMWQTIVWTVLRSVSLNVNGEVFTAKGRADMVIQTPNNVYILEFKLNDTAANAIKQIRKLKYHLPYKLTKKGITLIGLGFSAKKRTITSKKITVLRKAKEYNHNQPKNKEKL